MKPLSLIRSAALIALVWLTNFPIAMAGALTDHAENKLADARLRGQTLGAPATWHIGVTTDTCSDSSAGTEPSGGSYARVAVTAGLTQWSGTQSAGSTAASSGTGGTVSNNAAITFPASSAAWGNLQSTSLAPASPSVSLPVNCNSRSTTKSTSR